MIPLTWNFLTELAPSLEKRLSRHTSFIKQKETLVLWQLEECLSEMVQSNRPLDDISLLTRTLKIRLEEELEDPSKSEGDRSRS